MRLITLLTVLFFSTFQSVVHAEKSADQAQKDNGQAITKVIRMATTTSTENSGLLEYLLPDFEKQTGYKVHVIAVGTGKALRMGRDGDVDILLVHAPGAETKFVEEGYGVVRVPVMHNDFVIVGPKSDPSTVGASKDLAEAMKQISSGKAPFVSRGDDSGTHKKERGLWEAIDIEPKGEWYREAGQGMGKVLQMAGELDGYTLTDRGTWLAYKDKSPLQLSFEGDKKLFNPYSIIAINPAKYGDLNHNGASALIHWITSKHTQKLIADFKRNGEQLFIPDYHPES